MQINLTKEIKREREHDFVAAFLRIVENTPLRQNEIKMYFLAVYASTESQRKLTPQMFSSVLEIKKME